jgi:hypothetical protein
MWFAFIDPQIKPEDLEEACKVLMEEVGFLMKAHE